MICYTEILFQAGESFADCQSVFFPNDIQKNINCPFPKNLPKIKALKRVRGKRSYKTRRVIEQFSESDRFANIEEFLEFLKDIDYGDHRQSTLTNATIDYLESIDNRVIVRFYTIDGFPEGITVNRRIVVG